MNLKKIAALLMVVSQLSLSPGDISADEPALRAPVGATTPTLLLKSSITRVQPMTGIVLWSDHEDVATDAISLEFRYCGYDEVVQPDGSYDFSLLDGVLDQIASRGHQAVLRFYFVYPGKPTTVPAFIRQGANYRETLGKSEGLKTHFCDWTNPALQRFTLDFYSKIAARYDLDPRVAFLQTGFGLWAEYHIYDGPSKLGQTFPSKDFQVQYLRHLHQCFSRLPWSISVDAADSDYSPIDGNRDLLALNFGLFDDSFLCKSHPQENALNWKVLDLERWKRAPAGGEFSYYNQRDQRLALSQNGPNGISFAEAARQFHISYMIGSDQPQYQSLAHIAQAGGATGYRFRITAARTIDAGLELTVTNDGVAPFYRDAYFAIGNKVSKESLKGLLPQGSMRCVIPGATAPEAQQLEIDCDSLLPSQSIQFAADLQLSLHVSPRPPR